MTIDSRVSVARLSLVTHQSWCLCYSLYQLEYSSIESSILSNFAYFWCMSWWPSPKWCNMVINCTASIWCAKNKCRHKQEWLTKSNLGQILFWMRLNSTWKIFLNLNFYWVIRNWFFMLWWLSYIIYLTYAIYAIIYLQFDRMVWSLMELVHPIIYQWSQLYCFHDGSCYAETTHCLLLSLCLIVKITLVGALT